MAESGTLDLIASLFVLEPSLVFLLDAASIGGYVRRNSHVFRIKEICFALKVSIL